MNETKFKVLMHCGAYVDANLLENGIYATQKPVLYPQDITIGMMAERGKYMKDMTGKQFLSDKYFENLKQCQFVSVTLTID